VEKIWYCQTGRSWQYNVGHALCMLDKATDTHTEYVTLTAFPQQRWLCECTWMWCLYVHWLSCIKCVLATKMKYESNFCFKICCHNRNTIYYLFPPNHLAILFISVFRQIQCLSLEMFNCKPGKACQRKCYVPQKYRFLYFTVQY